MGIMWITETCHLHCINDGMGGVEHKGQLRVLCGFRKYPYPPQGWSLEILRGWGGSKAITFKKSMKLNWNFQRGGEIQSKNHPWGRYGYFPEPHISGLW